MKFLVNPSKFNEMADYLFRPLLILSIILFAIGLLFSISFSFQENELANRSQRR